MEVSENLQNPEQMQSSQLYQDLQDCRQFRVIDIQAETVMSARQGEQAEVTKANQIEVQTQVKQPTQNQGVDRRLRVRDVVNELQNIEQIVNSKSYKDSLNLSQIQITKLTQIIEENSQLQTLDFVSKLEQIQTSTFVQNQTQNQVQTSTNSKGNDVIKTTNQIGFITKNDSHFVCNNNINNNDKLNVNDSLTSNNIPLNHATPRVRLQIPITNRDILLKAS